LKIDNGFERIDVKEAKLMHMNSSITLENLRNENNKLLTTIDGLLEEKGKQDQQINEIQAHLNKT
jgi:hypothetical protein